MSYIPIVKDSVVNNYDIDSELVIVHASHIMWRPSVLPRLKEKFKVVIDIETNRLVTADAKKSDSYKKLPYNIESSDFGKIFTNSTFRLQKLVEPVVQFQIDNDSEVIMVPYLMFTEWRSRTFTVNSELIADTINHIGGRNDVNKPLYAVINISNEALRSMESVSYIKDRYLEFSDDLSGYIVIPDSFAERNGDPNNLLNLARLVNGLKVAGKEVWVFPIGGFGQVLHALGAKNFGSGIFSKETSSVAMFDSDGEVYPRSDRWIYHPDIFVYVNAVALKKSGYKCDCLACSGDIAPNLSLKKQHDALVRVKAGKAMNSVPESDKLEYVKQKIQNAITIVRDYDRQQFGPRSAYYLEKWLSVVDSALSWPKTVEEEDDLLNELLVEIDSET